MLLDVDKKKKNFYVLFCESKMEKSLNIYADFINTQRGLINTAEC